ncbi:hypothetical protein ABFS82_11G028300 [Erythranthe guttata]|uniref:IBH1-like N-terminal domain-containing protein n=1 Tax=Erythranthe guttata TaxID=4155 RepID=A0A022R0R2_ERYGU|nr:PREDICTED: transcription factor IBH1 [Erythranthe guttata]EYU34297.1 hypothetical protein MIMGU_mgv1a014245mg [Erythranthe guttata]|eukprot:XP_012841055.1 PREDICTED: transcription factor IBH1 [Erythranthe guttata]
MKSRMPENRSESMKQEFLKKWIKGLQIYSKNSNKMTILDRKNAIKQSADVAIASTRNAETQWSRAVMARIASKNETVVEKILGRKVLLVDKNKSRSIITCSKKIVRRSIVNAHRKKARVVRSISSVVEDGSIIAKKMVKKRTRVLKRLVPGGEQMDEVSLIKETLDYIASLQVQVDVMRNIAAAAEILGRTERLSF